MSYAGKALSMSFWSSKDELRQGKESLQEQFEPSSRLYDRKTHGRRYECGYLVWLHAPAVPWGQSKKLRSPWTGLFRVVRKLSNAVCSIQIVRAPCQRLFVHFYHLKFCPPDMCFPSAFPPATMPAMSPSQSPKYPPGRTLQILVDVDPTSSCYLQQKCWTPQPWYPQRQRSAPDYYLHCCYCAIGRQVSGQLRIPFLFWAPWKLGLINMQ